MKKSFTGLIFLLAGACVAYPQGSVVFGNYGFGASRPAGSPSGYMYVSLYGARIGATGGTALGFNGKIAPPWAAIPYGDDWSVTLYGAAGANDPMSALSPLIDYSTGLPIVANLADGTSDGLQGTWFSVDSAIVPNDPAPNEATIQVYAWYNGGGMITLREAMASGPEYGEAFPWGASAPGNTALGGATGGAPLAPVVMPNLGNIDIPLVLPEPSTIALGLLGAFAFLFRRQRVVSR
jgi:hypothetical protein